MASQVNARKALKDARQGKKLCFRSDYSEGFFYDLAVLFSMTGPLVALASQGLYAFPREGILEDAQLAEQFILVRHGGVGFHSNEGFAVTSGTVGVSPAVGTPPVAAAPLFTKSPVVIGMIELAVSAPVL